MFTVVLSFPCSSWFQTAFSLSNCKALQCRKWTDELRQRPRRTPITQASSVKKFRIFSEGSTRNGTKHWDNNFDIIEKTIKIFDARNINMITKSNKFHKDSIAQQSSYRVEHCGDRYDLLSVVSCEQSSKTKNGSWVFKGPSSGVLSNVPQKFLTALKSSGLGILKYTHRCWNKPKEENMALLYLLMVWSLFFLRWPSTTYPAIKIEGGWGWYLRILGTKSCYRENRCYRESPWNHPLGAWTAPESVNGPWKSQTCALCPNNFEVWC